MNAEAGAAPAAGPTLSLPERAARLFGLLQPRLPVGTALVVHPIADYRASLLPAEACAVERAVQRRQVEFATGRVCARAALESFGCAPEAIGVGGSREPLWPDGFVGSISHSHGLCVVMVHRQEALETIGTDLSSTEPLDDSLREFVCTENELLALETARSPVDPHKLAFATKEALFKAAFPLVGRYIDFLEVSVDVDLRRGSWVSTTVASDLEAVSRIIEGDVVVSGSDLVATAWCRPL